jgi:hypothetical protein
LQVFFTLLGSTRVKAARKALVKLTQGRRALTDRVCFYINEVKNEKFDFLHEGMNSKTKSLTF